MAQSPDNSAPLDRPKTSEQAPAAGERRAIGGYQPQYRLAAEFILKRLREGTLTWIKIADPDAGRLDDLQIAEEGRLDAYQVKWSRFPAAFTFRDLKAPGVDAPSLISQLADGWSRLQATNPGRRVVVHLITNDQPSTNDKLPGTPDSPSHFAAFLAECWVPRTTEPVDETTIPERWKAAWVELTQASGLATEDFERFVAHCKLDFGTSQLDGPRTADSSSTSLMAVRELSAWWEDVDALNLALFKLVADPRQIVELSRDRLLHELRWRDRVEFRNRHEFPEPGIPYQAVRETVDDLDNAIKLHSSGYLLLIGSPGSGKSTLLTQTTRYRAERVVRYYAYVPDALEPNALRGEAVNFLHDVGLTLDRLGFHAGSTLSTADPSLLVSRFHEQLRHLHEDFRDSGRKTIIVVDGLDHIAREQSPQRSLLKDLPSPANIPEGVYIILGSQTDQLQDLPPQVRTQLREHSRRLEMRRLSRAAVVAAVSGANLSPEPAGMEFDRIFNLSGGHPLALAYIINYLRASSGASPGAVLDAVEPFKDRIDDQYETHWLAIEDNRALLHLLGLYARMSGAIDSHWIERWADKDALFAVRRFQHYFRREPDGRQYFFHNSFRAFLLERTRILPGVSSSAGDAGLYHELAEHCANPPEDSPWRWDELYYRAHAGEDIMVLQLAAAEVLRAQFLAGRPIDAIQADIRHAIRSSIRRKDLAALSSSILTGAEYEYRERNVPNVPLPELFIALGKPNVAVEHVRDGNRLRVSPITALKTSDVLARTEHTDEAERIFDLAEPLEVLKGGEVPSDHTARDADELLGVWIRLAPRFRPLKLLLNIINRLRRGESRWEKNQDTATRNLRSNLQFQLASTLYQLNRWDDFAFVVGRWNPIDPSDWGWWFWSHVHAWRHAQSLGDEARALSLFDVASLAAASHVLDYDQSVMLAEGFLRIRRDTVAAARETNALPQPIPVNAQDSITSHGFEPFRQRFRLNRVLGALGDTTPFSELVPNASDPDHEDLVFFERLVAHVARLWGQAWAGRVTSTPTFLQEAHPVLRFFSQTPKSARSSWYWAQRGRKEIYSLLIDVAKMHGAEVVDALRGAFQEEWTKLEYAKYWGAETIRDVVFMFLDARAPRTWAAECLALADARVPDTGDANTRMTDNEEQLRAHLALGHTAAAEQKLRVVLESSFAVGHKDSQLAHWIAWAELATAEDPARGAERFAWIASYLPSLRECDEVLPFVAKVLLRAVCKWNPAAGVVLLKWYFTHGVVSFTEGVDTLLESLVRMNGELADVVASIYSHFALPLDTGGSSVVQEIGRAFVSRARATSAPQSTVDALHTQWEHIQVSALPSTRHSRWRVLSSVVQNAGLTEPQFKEPVKLRTSGSQDDDEDATGTIKEFGDPPLTMDMIRELATSLEGVLELLRRETPNSFFRWGKLVSELITKANKSELGALGDAFRQKGVSGRAWEVDLMISRRLLELGDSKGAWSLAERVMHASPAYGWQERYDGGSRLRALETLGAIDRPRAHAVGFEALASDLHTGGVHPSTIVEELNGILPAITDVVPTLEIWKVVEDYLKALFATSKAVTKPDLTIPADSDIREVLLRFVADFLDHPTYQLAIASQRIFVDLVRNEDPSARRVVADLLRSADKPHLVLLAVLEAVNQDAPTALMPLRESIALGEESPHQGVRAAARRLLGVVDQDDVVLKDEPIIVMPEKPTRRTPAPLPAVYQLAFKPRGRIHRIREVAADRPLSLTENTGEIVEVFRAELDLLAEAAGVQPEALYERVVQIASGHDSRAFADAEQQLRTDLDAISLRLTFRRPRPRAVRRAMFLAFAEFVDAQLISNTARRGIERVLQTHDPDFLRRRPVRRPSAIRSIAECSTDGYTRTSWTAGVNTKASALLAPRSTDGLVLAEMTELRWLQWEVPTEIRCGVSLSGWPPEEILRTEQDPLARLCERWVQALVEEYACRAAKSESLIILQEGVRFETPAQRWLAFNPTIARRLGWTLDSTGLFRWLSREGQMMVESIWWEDGCLLQRPPHFQDEVGSGWIVIASPSGAETIRHQYGRLTTCVRVERQANEQTKQVATFQDLAGDS